MTPMQLLPAHNSLLMFYSYIFLDMHLCVVCMVHVCTCLHMCDAYGCMERPEVDARRLLQLLSTSFPVAGSLTEPEVQ